jgi:hypothetical protein
MGPANEVFGRQQLHYTYTKYWSKTLPLNGIYFVLLVSYGVLKAFIDHDFDEQTILCEWWESTAHTFCKYLHGEMHSLGENGRLKRSTFPQPRPLHILGPQDIRLLFRELQNEACLFLWAIIYFSTDVGLIYLRKYILLATKHFLSGAATRHGCFQYDLPSRKYWWRAWHWVGNRLSRIYRFALSKFHQSDLYFSDLEFKYLRMTCSMTLLEKKSINLCYFYS